MDALIPRQRPSREITLPIRVGVELGPESRAQLDRIERLIRALAQRMEIDMSELDDKLTAIETAEAGEETALATLGADEQRELADLQALQAGGQTLTADQAARLDALAAKVAQDTAAVQADTAAIDAADPAPPAAPAA